MRLFSIPAIVTILLAFLAFNTVLADYKPYCNSGWKRDTNALSTTYKDLSTCQNKVLEFDKLNDILIGGNGNLVFSAHIDSCHEEYPPPQQNKTPNPFCNLNLILFPQKQSM